MSGSQPVLWPNSPYTPKIPRLLYLDEKANFAGILIGSILYGTPPERAPTYPPRRFILTTSPIRAIPGIVIVLFFKCMAALFNPVHLRGESIKWWLVSCATVMFSVATVLTAVNLDVQSISYIDNRKFSGIRSVAPPGPLGYQVFTDSTALVIVPNLMFLLNNWLADALLVSSLFFNLAFTQLGG